MMNGLVVAVERLVDVAQVVVRIGVIGLQPHHLFECPCRLLQLSRQVLGVTQVVQYAGIAGIALQGLAVTGLCGVRLPQAGLDVPLDGQRSGMSRIERQ